MTFAELRQACQLFRESLRETTGRERHRLFVYESYLAILNEGTEPFTSAAQSSLRSSS